MGKLFDRKSILEEVSDIDDENKYDPDDTIYGGSGDYEDDDDNDDFDEDDEDELNDYIEDADEMTVKFERRPEEISVMVVPTVTGDENYVDYDDVEKLADYEECTIKEALSKVCALYEGMDLGNTRVVLAEKSAITKSLKEKDKKDKKKMKKKLDELKKSGVKIATDKKSKKGTKTAKEECDKK